MCSYVSSPSGSLLPVVMHPLAWNVWCLPEYRDCSIVAVRSCCCCCKTKLLVHHSWCKYLYLRAWLLLFPGSSQWSIGHRVIHKGVNESVHATGCMINIFGGLKYLIMFLCRAKLEGIQSELDSPTMLKVHSGRGAYTVGEKGRALRETCKVLL